MVDKVNGDFLAGCEMTGTLNQIKRMRKKQAMSQPHIKLGRVKKGIKYENR